MKYNNATEVIEVSVVVFYDGLGNVIVQKRGNKSRNNEKYALWGGKVKKGETEKDAIKRELTEELGFIPKTLNKCGDYKIGIEEGKYKGGRILYHVYLAPITEGLIDTQVYEGEKMVMFRAKNIVTSQDFFQADRYLINQILNEGKII